MLDMFRRLSPEFGDALTGVNGFRRPDVTFQNDVTIDFGGVAARVLWLGAAHTQGDQRTPGPVFEVASHEGNYAMQFILSGHRAQEKQP